MRRTVVLGLILVVPVLAGCVSDAPSEREPEPAEAPAPPYSRFLCAVSGPVSAFGAGEGNGSRCNVRITDNLPHNNFPANELTIAVDPDDPMRLVAGAKDYSIGPDDQCGVHRVWSGYYWSSDGGMTWGNELMPGWRDEPTEDPQNPLAGYHCTTDPVLGWDSDGEAATGTAYYSGLSYAQLRDDQGNSVGSNVWLAKSTDGGKTFPVVHLVAQGDGATVFHDKQWFAVDPRNPQVIYFTWSMFVFPPALPAPAPPPPFGTDQIVFTRSQDGGRTWSPLRVLYESRSNMGMGVPTPELGKQFSMPVLDKSGVLHVIWMGAAKIWYTRSTDGGVTWSEARAILDGIRELPSPLPPTSFRVSTYPVLAADESDAPGRDNLYVAFAAVGSDETGADIFVTRSVDQGNTWSAPVKVNDDGTTGDQFMPWIDVGAQGDVHVVFHDRRDDPENRLVHTYYAHSSDGVRWDPNIRVSEVAMDSRLSHHQGGFEFIGDYIGISEGSNGWVHPIWVDTRNGRADAYTVVIAR